MHSKGSIFIIHVHEAQRLQTCDQALGSGAQTLHSVSSFNGTQACAGNIRASAVMSSHATHTVISPGPVLPTITQPPAVPERPPPPSVTPSPNTSPVGGVMSGLCGGLLLTGPDNQRVCKCVIYQSLFMVRVLKEDIFMVIVAGLFYYIFM